MAVFSRDPYTHYNHIFDMAEQGADPVIPRTLRQLEPVRTEYAVYQYDFPSPVRPERGTAAATAPKYWGEQGAWYPQSTFPLGLQLMDYLNAPVLHGKPLPGEVANRLTDPLPEGPPEAVDDSHWIEWGYRWVQAQETDGSLAWYRVQQILFLTPLRPIGAE